jgi:hypothetical protein
VSGICMRPSTITASISPWPGTGTSTNASRRSSRTARWMTSTARDT